MTVDTGPEAQLAQPPRQSSPSTAAARNLATTTESAPPMQEITSRWLLRMLPRVETKGGTYRVNRSQNKHGEAEIAMSAGHTGEGDQGVQIARRRD